MFDSYECELKTDAPYFAQWFWMTLLDCAPLEMDVDLGRGKAELEGPGNHSDYVMNVKWKLVTHEYLNYGDEQELLPRIIEYRRRHLELLRVGMPEIGFRAKPAAPGRLQVSLWVSGLGDELQGAWDCLIGEIKKTYSLTTPAAQPSSGAAVTAQTGAGSGSNPLDLTQREREIADLLVQGLSRPEAAEELMISHGTAKKHAENIAQKAKDAGHEVRPNRLSALLKELGYGKTTV